MGKLVVYSTAAGGFISTSRLAWSKYLEPRLKWRENYHNIEDETNRGLVEARLNDSLFRYGWGVLAVVGVVGSVVSVVTAGVILNWRPVSGVATKLRYGLLGAVTGWDIVNLIYFFASAAKFFRFGWSRPQPSQQEPRGYDDEGRLVKPRIHSVYRYLFFAPSIDSDRQMLTLLYALAGFGCGVAYTLTS